MKFSAFGDDRFTDAVVKCGGQTWNVHRVIVCRESEWFAKALCGNFTEASTRVIEIHDFEPTNVEKVLRYIYSGEDPAAKLSPGESTYSIQLIGLYQSADYFVIGLHDKALGHLQRYLENVARDVQHRYLSKVTGFKTDKKRMKLFEDCELSNVICGAAVAFEYGLDRDDVLQKAFTSFVNATCYIALADCHFIRRMGEAADFAVAILQERHQHGGWLPMSRYAPKECEVCQEKPEVIFGQRGDRYARIWTRNAEVLGRCSRCQDKLDEQRREEVRVKKAAASASAAVAADEAEAAPAVAGDGAMVGGD
ncbi:hypothetical protein PG996_012217 [Apiospora saccharicola]|uniref:BTB domain-containing protein n=1 Tax=Apiospora saccharicola TaxID=335842 RepID=A0ABR1U1Y4_9PEZI